jgi:hypothetical protein
MQCNFLEQPFCLFLSAVEAERLRKTKWAQDFIINTPNHLKQRIFVQLGQGQNIVYECVIVQGFHLKRRFIICLLSKTSRKKILFAV